MERIIAIHTGDVHLGMSGAAFGGRAGEHRRLLREAFARVVEACREHGAQLLIVAGDLFDNPQPARSTAEFVRAQLARLAEVEPVVEVVLLPGTHDPLTPGSVYAEWQRQGLPAHVHLLSDPQGQPVALAGGEVLVHGGPGCLHPRADAAAAFNVGVVHASVRLGHLRGGDEPMLSPEAIAATGMDYLALGHWHRGGDYSNGGVTALYSGSPEITAIDQAEQGQVLRVELRRGTGARWAPLTVGRLRRREVELNLADFDSGPQLLEELRRYADPEVVLEATLSGLAHAGFHYDTAELEEELAADFFRVRLRDEALPAAEEITESRYPPELIVGRFVRLMLARRAAAQAAGDTVQTEIETQALQWGLALLEKKESV